MTAGVLEVEETIEHLEPGDDTSCDCRGCEQKAFWWVTCRGCKTRHAACTRCVVRLEIFHALRGAVCLLCGRTGETLDAVIALEPIGGGS